MYQDNMLSKSNHLYTKVNTYIAILCCLYFFLSFYEGYINKLIGSVTKYLIMIIIITLILNNKRFIFKWYHLSMFIWFFLKVVSIFWTRDITIMQEHIISQIGMVLFFIVMTSVRYDKKFIDAILNTMLYTSASMGVLGLFFSKSYHGTVESRQVLTLFGVETDPNNMAAYYMVGVALALVNIIYERKKIGLNMIIVGINAFCVAMTGSRGGVLTFISIIFVLIISTNKSKNIIKNTVYKTILFTGITLVIYLILQRFLPNIIFKRIFSFDSYAGGSERDFIWKNALSLFLKYPIFGAGWGAFYGYNGIYAVVHNTYISMLCDVGIIGFLLFFTPVIWNVKESLKIKMPFVAVILATSLVPSMFLDAINKRFFWNAIIMAFVLINGQKNNEKKLV